MSGMIDPRVASCWLYLCTYAFIHGSSLCWCCLLTHGFRLFTLFIYCVFRLYLVRSKKNRIFGLVIARDDDFEVSMPSNCLVIACGNDYESSMLSYHMLRWIPIFSSHVMFLDVSCVFYSDLRIVLLRSMLRFFLTHLSRLFCLWGELFFY